MIVINDRATKNWSKKQSLIAKSRKNLPKACASLRVWADKEKPDVKKAKQCEHHREPQRATALSPTCARNPAVRDCQPHAAAGTRRAGSAGDDRTVEPTARRYDDASRPVQEVS